MVKRTAVFLVLLSIPLGLLSQQLIDKHATPETKALFTNLIKLSQSHILVGHHEADAYGVGWSRDAGRSDIKDVCGSHPAVHGWDLGHEGAQKNIDGVDFAAMHQWIKEVYDRGGVNTISWHVNNPVSGKGSWDTTRAVVHILPGGKYHDQYKAQLDYVATFLHACKSGSTMIPIIFRPFHEHNGNWFWWGKGNCTEQEYIQLWRFTVDYLKDEKKLNNILYAFSPDRSRMNIGQAKATYLYGYPGDDYVDILGLDNYMDVGVTWNKKSPEVQRSEFVLGLRAVSELAKEKNKCAALTETGLEGVTNAAWFTEVILNPLKANPGIQLAYIMLWRNATIKHHYAPYTGHASVPDFLKFFEDAYTLFEDDVQHLYSDGKKLLR